MAGVAARIDRNVGSQGLGSFLRKTEPDKLAWQILFERCRRRVFAGGDFIQLLLGIGPARLKSIIPNVERFERAAQA